MSHYWKVVGLGFVFFFLLLNVLYKAMKEHVILMAVRHQGIPTLPMEKKTV